MNKTIAALILLVAPAMAQNIWQPVSFPAAAKFIRDFAVDPTNNDWFVVDDGSGVWRSTNQGSAWTQINSGLPAACSAGSPTFICGWTIDYDPYHHQLLLGLCDHCDHGGNPGVSYWRSSNDGTSWTSVPNPAGWFNSSLPANPSFNPTGTMGVWGGHWLEPDTAGYCGNFWSTDGFQTSTIATAANTYTENAGIQCDSTFVTFYNPIKGDFWIAGETNGIYESPDGKAFTQVSPPSCGYVPAGGPCLNNGDWSAINSLADGTVIAGGNAGLYKQNGGTFPTYNWTEILHTNSTSWGNGPYALFRDANGYIYAGTANTAGNPNSVAFSKDQGATWQVWSSGIALGSGIWRLKYNAFDGRLFGVHWDCNACTDPIYRTISSITGGGQLPNPTPPSPPSSGGGQAPNPTPPSPPPSSGGGQAPNPTPPPPPSSGGGHEPNPTPPPPPSSGGGHEPDPTPPSSEPTRLPGTSDGHRGTISQVAIDPNLPTAYVGAGYSGSVSASGGVAPYHYSVVDGALPKGVFIGSNTGSITGIPSTVGTFGFRVAAVDSKGSRTAYYGRVYVLYGSSREATGVVVSVSPTSGTIAPGQTQRFTSHVSGTTNTLVAWSASAGTISNLGLFTAPMGSSTGTVTITATSIAASSKKASANLTISPAPVTGISVAVSPLTANLNSGSTQQFSATVQGTGNTAVRWSASAGAVSSAGLFIAPKVSSNTNVAVTATSVANTTKRSSAMVSVTPPVSSALTITTSYLPGAQPSTAYSYALQASGGTAPYQWTVASGSLPKGFSLTSTGQLSGTTTQTGQFSFSAKVTDAKNNSTSQALSLSVAAPVPTGGGGGGGSYDGPAQLPQIFMQTTMANTPAPGSVTLVNAGGSLQNALNNANCGDTIELAAGATFAGNVTFPAKACDNLHWIIVRTSAPDTALPPEGTRMLPCYAGVSSLPGRPVFRCPSGVTNALARIVAPVGTGSAGPISFANGANYYRLVGLEITRTPGGIDYNMVVGKGTADHIILDRVWLHGSPQDDNQNGFGLNGMTYAALIDSYANDFHCTAGIGNCTDSHVVAGGTSTTQDGPWKIHDNFIESSGEGILFGGASANTTPADIEITGNHFFKPMIWLKNQPGFVGGADPNAKCAAAPSPGCPFIVKNHLEFKNAQRVLIEGNIMENVWGGFSQAGFSIGLGPKSQAVSLNPPVSVCPLCMVQDITIRYNSLSHMGAGMVFADAPSDAGGCAQAGQRWSIHDDVMDDISSTKYAGSGTAFQVSSSCAAATPAEIVNNVSINHVTAFPDAHLMYIGGSLVAGQTMYGFWFSNNIFSSVPYPVQSTGGGPSNCAYSGIPLTTMNACFPAGYSFTHNALVAPYPAYPASKWPAGQFFPANVTAVGFVNFSNGNGGDYHLTAASPYKNAGTDGKDLGADINLILAATANAY